MEGTWQLIVPTCCLSSTKWFYAVTSLMLSTISTSLKRYCRTKFYTFRLYLLTNVSSKLSISTFPESSVMCWTVPKLKCAYSIMYIIYVVHSASSGNQQLFSQLGLLILSQCSEFSGLGVASKYSRLLVYELLHQPVATHFPSLSICHASLPQCKQQSMT